MPDVQDLLTLYEKAEKMYEEGKLEGAISEFGKIIEISPKNQLAAKATNFIGDIYFDIEDYSNAEVYFKEAIKIDPNLIEAYRNLGYVYDNQEKYDDAIVQFEKAIDANPDTELKAECLKSIGDVYYYNQEKYDDALTEYNKILELNVDNAFKSETFKAIGQIYVLKGDNNQALKKFSEAKELDNTLWDAQLQLASAICDKDSDEGLAQYKQIIKSNPNSDLAAKAYIEIGGIYSDGNHIKEDFNEAEKNYREAIKISPNSKLAAVALNNIGAIYYSQKKKDTAIENYKEAIKIDPDLEDAHYNLSITFKEKKMHPEALLEINEAIRINPENSDYYNFKGNIYWIKQYQKAIEAYKEAIKIDPTNYWPYDNLARIYENKKQKEKAIEVWIKSLKYAHLDEEGRDKTGKVKKHLNKLGVTDKEIEMMKSNILNTPPEPETKKDPLEKPPQVNDFLIATLIKNTFLPYNFYMKIADLLEEKPQLIFYGVPGTGKTFVAKEFAKYFTNASEADLKNQFKLIQFHQSYSYEEFMEGIRPEPLKDNKGMSYPIKAGIFKTFCEEAGNNKDKKYLLIIDEINRGNISKIFGELLFLLEYRDEQITLPYSKNELFSIPKNVYIIGTMNTADRSIAFVDYALRRRFNFQEFLPNKEVLEKWLNENPDKKSGIDVLNLFTKLNDKIKNDLDENHQIGHSYFMIKKGTLDEKRLKLIWDYNIIPLLKEYFFTKKNLDDYSFESMIKS